MIKHQVRQGDIMLDPVASLPPDAKRVPVKAKHIVLASGVNGSTHSVPAKDATYYRADSKLPPGARTERLRNSDSHTGLAVAYLVVKRKTKVSHAAPDTPHTAVPLEPLVYEVVRAREADVTGTERQVED
jgi:hypothetical protein